MAPTPTCGSTRRVGRPRARLRLRRLDRAAPRAGSERSAEWSVRSSTPSRTGTSGPSSTRSWSGGSTTPTATAPATSPGITAKLDYLQWLGVDCLWLLPVLPVAAARRRLRHQRLLDHPARVRRPGRRRRADRGGPQAGHPGDRRPGHEPHVATSIPGSRSPARTGPTPRPTGTCGATTTRVPPRPGSSSSTPRSPTGPSTPAGPVLLAPVLLPSAGPQLRQPRGGRRHARRLPLLARHRPRRLPARRRALPLRAGRHQRREPA